jgi:2-dehydro-3-deoxyphosphogalactonate aldolase
MPASIVVMGVAGCGKSSLATGIAADAGLPVIEGDEYHSAGSLAKMRSGVALTDADRADWLAVLGDQLRAHPGGAVLTCSALRRAYRDRLRAACPGLRFVFLDLTRDEAHRRVASRGASHFFSAGLVDSQFATLESPIGEDGVLRVDALAPLDELRRRVGDWLSAASLDTAPKGRRGSSPMTWPTELPLIAILRGIRPDEAVAHALALVEAGFDAIEIPLNSSAWERSVRLAADACAGTALVGAGTVLREADVDALEQAGGRLVVTPNTRPSVIVHAVRRGLWVAAGFATASEAFDALDAGAQALKVFPAATYGPGHVKALRAVLPPVPIFAVGGVTPSNLPDYLRAGCTGAGLGSDLYKAGQNVALTAQRAREFVAAYREAVA